MIASTVRFQVSDYSELSDYNWVEWLVKNKAANARFIFEEFVMIMKIHSENGETLLFFLQRLFERKRGGAHSFHWTDKADELHRYYFDELIGTVRYGTLRYGRSIQMNISDEQSY